jgi:hypothetical protein
MGFMELLDGLLGKSMTPVQLPQEQTADITESANASLLRIILFFTERTPHSGDYILGQLI